MSNPKVGGHLPDPVSSSYWSFLTLKHATGIKASDTDPSDLRPYSSAVHNQRNSGSCVANSVAKALETRERLHHNQQGQPMRHTDISRLHLYFLSRELHRAQDRDEGTFISLCCEALKRFGIARERDWPFDLNNIFVSPPWRIMRKAHDKKIGVSGYYRIKSSGNDRVNACIEALASGYPVVYGTTVDKKWFNYDEGEVLRPVKAGESEGRHATVLMGWEPSSGLFIGENSWGGSWGIDGCYMMAPEVIAHRDSFDFWVMRGHWESAPR